MIYTRFIDYPSYYRSRVYLPSTDLTMSPASSPTRTRSALSETDPGIRVSTNRLPADVHAAQLEQPRDDEAEEWEVRDVGRRDARAHRRRLRRELLDRIVEAVEPVRVTHTPSVKLPKIKIEINAPLVEVADDGVDFRKAHEPREFGHGLDHLHGHVRYPGRDPSREVGDVGLVARRPS